jgi:hypothetical protein
MRDAYRLSVREKPIPTGVCARIIDSFLPFWPVTGYVRWVGLGSPEQKQTLDSDSADNAFEAQTDGFGIERRSFDRGSLRGGHSITSVTWTPNSRTQLCLPEPDRYRGPDPRLLCLGHRSSLWHRCVRREHRYSLSLCLYAGVWDTANDGMPAVASSFARMVFDVEAPGVYGPAVCNGELLLFWSWRSLRRHSVHRGR